MLLPLETHGGFYGVVQLAMNELCRSLVISPSFRGQPRHSLQDAGRNGGKATAAKLAATREERTVRPDETNCGIDRLSLRALDWASLTFSHSMLPGKG